MASREYLGARAPSFAVRLSDGRINGHDSDQATLISDNGSAARTAQNATWQRCVLFEGSSVVT
jgi:hypothetical protein